LKNSSRRDKDPFLLFSVKRNPEKLKDKKLASSLELKYGEEASYLPSIF
jgi:hypothetical protein